MFKIVIFFTFSVLCVVNSQSEDGCSHSKPYTRVKRGTYYPGPPLRFYNRPPMTFPIKGPFSYTPPPFIQDDEAPYPGSKPYKVSKRPTHEGLGDDDINNLVKYLSKQDLDKIMEFANEKNKYSEKGKDVDFGYSRPYKRENLQKPAYTKDFYQGTIDTKYQEEKQYEMELKRYVTQAAPVKFPPQDDRRNPYPIDTESNRVKVYGRQEDRPSHFKVYSPQDALPTKFNIHAAQHELPTQFKVYVAQEDQRHPLESDERLTNKNFENLQDPNTVSSNISEISEEEKLPPPDNMRQEDFDISYTNNVPTVVQADSYQVENFGDLPLMNYNSKLHSVSSYHVPHYTVTQSKSQSPPSPSASFSSSQSFSSSSNTGLKPSSGAAHIKAPPVEPAPPPSVAKEQSDAHLKAIKIWSHRSKGAAYTLHDDGTLTPEWPRPKYG